MQLVLKTVVFSVLLSSSFSSAGRIVRELFTNEPCGAALFRCDNGRCIARHYRCDNDLNDCGDGSDEQDCEKDLTRLFRFEWIQQKREQAAEWLIQETKRYSTNDRWGYQAVRTAVALYLMNETYFIPGNGTGKALDYELRFQLLSKLALRNVADVSSTELASFLNAFIVSCINPRDFHGVDLVEELRSRVDSQDYTNPFVLLSLCNAGENMTTRDVHKLLNAFNLAHRELWTDIQAYAVMALSCAANQPDSNYDLQNITGLTRTLKALQNVNGTIDNLKTTGLVLQALIAAGDLKDRHNFNVEKAFLQLTDSQKVDGSFEDVLKAYYVLPVFGYKSLINISSSHCRVHDKGENDILREWRNQLGEKIQIRYSLWLGNDKYLERTLKLTVPASTRFYRIMEVAAQLDDRYRFKSTLRDGKPYIYAISRIEDDPEGEKFWFLYREAETLDNSTAVLIEKSPIDYIPEDGEHLAFWFRHGPWTT